jgi:hypothetical protein
MKSRRSRRNNSTRDRAVDIPQHIASTTINASRRYITSGSAITVTSADLVNSCGGMAISTTQIAVIAVAVKLKRVQVWSAVPITSGLSSTNVNTLRFTWGGVDNTPGTTNQIISDTSLTNSRPLYISTRPPKGSLSSWWMQADAGEPIFVVNGISAAGAITSCPAGTVIQVDAEFKLYASRAAGGLVLPTAAVVVSTFYYPLLDASSTKTCVPVDLPSVV